MVSLVDVGDLHEEVDIRGHKVEVIGISSRSFLGLLMGFPDLRKLATGQEIDPISLVAQAPIAIAAIIACATGAPGDENVEKVAGNLSVGEQVAIIEVAWRLTFPRGIKNFTQALEAMAAEAGAATGWAPDTRSPEPSSALQQPDTASTAPGDTPLGS